LAGYCLRWPKAVAWACLGRRPSLLEASGTNILAADLVNDDHFWDAVRKAVQDHRPSAPTPPAAG
jgi:hypothetical protein